MVDLHMSHYLQSYLDTYCQRHRNACAMKTCSKHRECQVENLIETILCESSSEQPLEGLRNSIHDVDCDQCVLALVLKAIDRTVPEEMLIAWMEKPSFDLKGFTPRYCLDQGHYEDLINALWLHEGVEQGACS